MRKVIPATLERYRTKHLQLGGSPKGELWGYFEIRPLRIISSGVGRGPLHEWEHVSVSCMDRCPTWEEMCLVKDLFWAEDETVLQFHPQQAEHVNRHPYCLHLWRQRGVDHPLPPRALIG